MTEFKFARFFVVPVQDTLTRALTVLAHPFLQEKAHMPDSLPLSDTHLKPRPTYAALAIKLINPSGVLFITARILIHLELS
jgi:hypothetical protein